MKRRNFLQKSLATATGISLSAPALKAGNRNIMKNKPEILNAYYFRAHMYTMVPWQVREDMQWMADLGTDVVSVGVIEQDLFAAVENIAIVCEEAEKVGMQVFAVPSRWGGLFAGAPKVPSLFSVKNPQTWILEKSGKPEISRVSGVKSSVHYPETYDFFIESLDEMFRLWPIKGVIWDEPKSYGFDYSPMAVNNLGPDAPEEAHVKATVDFHSSLNQHIKENYPGIITNLFAPADLKDYELKLAAQTEHLDYFGCDGRPWYNKDGGKLESSGKVLLGKDAGERFLAAARQNNKKLLMLIENHNLATEDIPLMDKRLPEVMKHPVDHLIYYYYPRNVAQPEKAMQVIKKHVGKK